MQRGHKLLHTAARLGCAPSLSAPFASPTADAAPTSCVLCLRNLASLSQFPTISTGQQDLLGQHQQRSLLPSSALHQQHRQLFGIGEATDTQKDYKERRLIGCLYLPLQQPRIVALCGVRTSCASFVELTRLHLTAGIPPSSCTT